MTDNPACSLNGTRDISRYSQTTSAQIDWVALVKIVRRRPTKEATESMLSKYKCYDKAEGLFLRFAASGWIPARWFQKHVPREGERHAKTGDLDIEIVSHCWNYAHLLVYQLSSLVRFPPTRARVKMTVYYSDEDMRTTRLLHFFSGIDAPNVTWDWHVLTPNQLFRRAIGRNDAALRTDADWIWFTDCDLMFRDDCLDKLVEQLQNRRDILVFPRVERCTSLLSDDDPLLRFDENDFGVVDIETDQFKDFHRSRATGPLQITHGDVARACGYCNALDYFQRPTEVWAKTYEDRTFRWLLGSQGVPVDVPGVYRIRHATKGRYTGSTLNAGVRSWLRRIS